MSKHTPGPWAIYVKTPSDVVIRKISKDGYELCAIARVSSGYANTHLIAAAPELLEALQKIAGNTYDEWTNGAEAARIARAAIAKATGEQA